MFNLNILVGLKPHIGTQRTPLGDVEVEFSQYFIWAAKPGEGEIVVGLVGKQPGAPINFYRQPNGQPWPEAIKQAVREHVAAMLGAGERREGQPPAPAPPELEEEEYEIRDDDEDTVD